MEQTLTQQSGFLKLAACGAPTLKVPVTDAESASRAWEAYRDSYGLGSSDLKRGCGNLIDQDGKVIATVSYNGRIWNPDGSLLWDNGTGYQNQRSAS